MVLDPRTKLLILSITSISVFLNESIVIECLFIIIPVWLLLQAKEFRMAIKQGIFFMVLLILQLFDSLFYAGIIFNTYDKSKYFSGGV